MLPAEDMSRMACPWGAPNSALFPPCPLKKSPLRSGTWPPRTANSSGYARHGLGARLWPSSDQKADSGIHRTVFFCCRHDTGGIKVQAVCHSRPAQRICALIVPDMGTYSARRLVISPSSGHSRAAAYNISYRIPLPDAQGGAVSSVSPEKQPPQIGHLAAHNRE